MVSRNSNHVIFLCLVFLSFVLAEAEQDHVERLKRSFSSYGKRLTPSLVAELGKRPKELYSFGIGKRHYTQVLILTNLDLTKYHDLVNKCQLP